MNKKFITLVLILALIVPSFGTVSAQVCPICFSDFDRYVCMVAAYDSTPCDQVFQEDNGSWTMCMYKSGGYTWLSETGKECMFGHIYDPSYGIHDCEEVNHSCYKTDGSCCPY